MENYDSESLTESDASEIVSQIEDLGVSPGRGLADSLSDVGFDAREIGELAGVKQSSGEAGGPKGDGGRPPPPPPSESGMTGQINSEAISALQVLIDGYDDTDLTEDDWTNIMTTLEESGFDISNGLMDVKV